MFDIKKNNVLAFIYPFEKIIEYQKYYINYTFRRQLLKNRR